MCIRERNQFKVVRDHFIDSLKHIPELEVYPTQANFVMCEIKSNVQASELTKELLLNDNIFIKDLSAKIKNGKQYIRLAVRREEENKRLVKALKKKLWGD